MKITKASLAKTIDALADLNKEYNSLDKDLKEKKNSFREEMNTLGLSELSGDRYTATISTRIKETLNEERTLGVLKQVGAKWLVHTKEYFSEEEIEQAVMTGELDPKIFIDCKDEKETKVLQFKKVKKGK